MTRSFVAIGFGMLIFCLTCGMLNKSSSAQESKSGEDQKTQQRNRNSQERSERAQQDRRPGQRGEIQRGNRGGRQRGGRGGGPDNSLLVGEIAPDFTLKALEGNEETTLSSFKGKKPVILFFGSYT